MAQFEITRHRLRVDTHSVTPVLDCDHHRARASQCDCFGLVGLYQHSITARDEVGVGQSSRLLSHTMIAVAVLVTCKSGSPLHVKKPHIFNNWPPNMKWDGSCCIQTMR